MKAQCQRPGLSGTRHTTGAGSSRGGCSSHQSPDFRRKLTGQPSQLQSSDRGDVHPPTWHSSAWDVSFTNTHLLSNYADAPLSSQGFSKLILSHSLDSLLPKALP